ncbi:hypothetical protein KUTeg_003891 [Tegillarca granosa]|uniref:Rhodanese domain-containing protein n=1 Tax=Tegillarca granosa TaxID=220873 RepID=A0ABQ9FNG6_TEGGR|nr:hypothetical protein KUTeg_003891 [Tegillarca granosa]
MDMNKIQTLVSTKWLHQCILRPQGSYNMRILDTSWYLPTANRDPKAEYAKKHIPGALYFDIDECCDKTSPYSHMLPKTADFERYVRGLGIDNQTHVIVYDGSDSCGFFSAQRIWWTFRVFGHSLVSLLDGGFKKWCSEGLPTTDQKDQVPITNFKADFQSQMVKHFEDIERNLNNKTFQLVDARGPGRFKGLEPEPRQGIKPGHIPNAVNIPFSKLVNLEQQTFKNKEELIEIFNQANIDLSKPLVATCGSVCVLSL